MGSKVERRRHPVRRDRIEERDELGDLPCLGLGPLTSLERQRIGERDDVADHGALPRSIAHRLVQHHMDVVDRLR